MSIVGVTRHVDQGILGDRRAADSQLAFADTRSTFIQQLERVVGTPGDNSSLSARIAAFDASLVAAASRPEATEWLQGAVLRANELADTLNKISADIQTRRTNADADIAMAVENVNSSLSRIRTLNIQIASAPSGSHTIAALQDQRQMTIDQLSEYIPVKQIPRENGALTLYTPGGAVLLDGTAATLDFTPSNVVAPHMTLAGGLLSGLTINGLDVVPSGNNSPISGGRLSALFEIRDDLGVDANTQVDALARDLIDRFQAAGLDATRAVGGPLVSLPMEAQYLRRLTKLALQAESLSMRLLIRTTVASSGACEMALEQWHQDQSAMALYLSSYKTHLIKAGHSVRAILDQRLGLWRAILPASRPVSAKPG